MARTQEFDEPWYGSNLHDRSTWVWYPIKGLPTPKWAEWFRDKPVVVPGTRTHTIT